MINAYKMRPIVLILFTAMACVACNASSGSSQGAGSGSSTGTASTGAPSSSATTCTEPRPQMCMELYMPACGTDKSGAQRTYANSCHACADKAVVSFVTGKCAAS